MLEYGVIHQCQKGTAGDGSESKWIGSMKGMRAEELLSKVPQTNLFNWSDWNVTHFVNSLPSWNGFCLTFYCREVFTLFSLITMKSHMCHGEEKMMPRRQQQKSRGQLSRLVRRCVEHHTLTLNMPLCKSFFFQTWQCLVPCHMYMLKFD